MTLSRLISQDHFMNVEKLMGNSFIVLRDRVAEFPSTVLNCVLNMGKAVYKTDESDMINFFIDNAVSLGFQSPMIGGVGDDWQIKANQAHIQNIRTWMELIEIMPKWSTRLLSGLIIHLTLCGVFIKDTDLFPRDITRFLNSEIEPVYNLCKQLARLFPTYFNDIGAEGLLRDISTEIDEITHRKDVLIHFLRKQTHVESSNRIIGFMESVISFWLNRDKKELKPFLPPAIYKSVETRGVYIDGVNKLVNHIAAKGIALPKGLLSITAGSLDDILESAEAGETDKKRIRLAVSLYQLLDKKYNLAGIEMTEYISRMNRYEAFPEIDELLASLQETDIKKKISGLLDYLECLKKIILSDQQFDVREDIYKKRHFTIDIPSMYGSYHELKFDALGLTFRIESILNILFEQLTESIDLSIITKATFFQIHQRLRLFNRALAIDGISSVELERQLELLAHSLDVKGFTFTQYLDIFKGLAQAVRNIIDDNFNNIHEYNLNNII
ncbi:pyruvate, phosphate dikinase, partial [Desulfobacterales bacterium HSG16]|nr:pyruvate, phosphate dikinase [Desulfobacterales bacterium HSG16]